MSSGARVLSLDGGGIRGLIILEILEAIEKETGKEIKDLFDWIGGTSTGGIIALDIATGMPVSKIKKMYEQLKDQVFTGSTPYDSTTIETLLKQQLGEESVMTDIKQHKVVVTSVLADHYPWKLHLFRSYNKKTRSKKREIEEIKPPNETYILEAARSTSAAPTYFHPYKQFIDGGLMSNNPTLDLLTEIHEFFTGGIEIAEEDITPTNPAVQSLDVVVSIGCGYVDTIIQSVPDPQKPSWWDVVFHPIDTHNLIDEPKQFLAGLLNQVSISHGRPTHRARAWCEMMKVPFSRFSPRLSENVPLDVTDTEKLEKMIMETKSYIKEVDGKIKNLAGLLK